MAQWPNLKRNGQRAWRGWHDTKTPRRGSEAWRSSLLVPPGLLFNMAKWITNLRVHWHCWLTPQRTNWACVSHGKKMTNFSRGKEKTRSYEAQKDSTIYHQTKTRKVPHLNPNVGLWKKLALQQTTRKEAVSCLIICFLIADGTNPQIKSLHIWEKKREISKMCWKSPYDDQINKLFYSWLHKEVRLMSCKAVNNVEVSKLNGDPCRFHPTQMVRHDFFKDAFPPLIAGDSSNQKHT